MEGQGKETFVQSLKTFHRVDTATKTKHCSFTGSDIHRMLAGRDTDIFK